MTLHSRLRPPRRAARVRGRDEPRCSPAPCGCSTPATRGRSRRAHRRRTPRRHAALPADWPAGRERHARPRADRRHCRRRCRQLGIRLEVVGRESLTQERPRRRHRRAGRIAHLARAHASRRVGRTARRQHHRRNGARRSAARPHLLAGAALVPDRVPGGSSETTAASGIASVVIASGRTRLDRARDDAGGHRRDRADRRTASGWSRWSRREAASS